MSTAPRKAAASEGLPEASTHAALMREMGSETGAWNPEPDEHITGLLRDDVELSPNELKLLAYVKACCLRQPRRPWGKTASGLPLTLQEIADQFGWDSGNAAKHARRPLAHGFIRKNSDGVYGIGARIRGTNDMSPAELYRMSCDDILAAGEEKKHIVCTDSIPQYLFAQFKGLSHAERKKFAQWWVSSKEAEKEELARTVKAVRNRFQEERTAEAKELFGIDIQRGPKPVKVDRKTAAEEEDLLSVQTVAAEEDEEFVQTANATLYSVENGPVQTAPPYKQSSELTELASSPEQAQASETRSAEIRAEVRDRLARAKLRELNGKPLDEKTLDNIAAPLNELGDAREIIGVLETLEEKARRIAREPANRTWGYIVNIVRGEVADRIEAQTNEIRRQLKTMSAGKAIQ